ncbi:MAG: hypothetical protein ACM37Z_12735, partial [Deltaproteobacteria bacterium]
KFAGTIAISEDFDTAADAVSGALTAFEMPYPAPTKALTKTGASNSLLKLIFSIMGFPPCVVSIMALSI